MHYSSIALILPLVATVQFGFSTCIASNQPASRNFDPYQALSDTFDRLRLVREPRDDSSGVQTSRPVHWIGIILREFFHDIDWDAIELAREQIEKFIHRLDRLLSFAWPERTKNQTELGNQTQTNGDDNGESERHRLISMLLSNRENTSEMNVSPKFWQFWSRYDPNKLQGGDSIKDALNQVACYVGYVRLLNESQKMLAELDASKVLTNLFANSQKKPGWLWGLYG